MIKHFSVITCNGEITIPADIRRALDLKPGDIIAWQREGNAIWITRAHYTLESAFGSVEPHSHPENFDALTDAAKTAKASATVDDLNER